MYNFIKKLPIFGAIFLLASCAGGVRIENIDKSYATDTAVVEAKIPQISGLSSESLTEAVNREYEKTITELLSDFKKRADETGDKSTFSVITTEHYNKNGFFSAVTEVESCAGGSHKNSFRITENIDTKKCEKVMLCDLFEGDDYIDMINARLLDAVEADKERYRGLWEKPSLSAGQDFYIDSGCLVLYYAPYKLSYYERGFVEIPLSLYDMSGYLKEEYRYLAQKE